MKVLAFDANSIVNRAFYGVRLLSTREGTYTNAVYGFFNIVYKLIEEQKPDAVAFAFDLHAPTFRHKMYEQYKGTRKGMPEELRQQMPLVKEMLRLLGYPILEVEGYEADDILGSLARQGEQNGDTVLICTGDRDSLKLITAGGEKALYELEAIQTNDNQTKSGIIDLFVDCLNDPSREGISAESVLPAMRAVFASIESSETGRAVRVNE